MGNGSIFLKSVLLRVSFFLPPARHCGNDNVPDAFFLTKSEIGDFTRRNHRRITIASETNDDRWSDDEAFSLNE